MNRSEYLDIIEFLRNQLRESKFVSLEEIISIETSNIENPKERLMAYLDMLINMIRERSNQRVQNINKRFENVLQIEGGRFSGVEVVLNDAESQSYDISRFSLDELDDVGGLISGLESVRNSILEEFE